MAWYAPTGLWLQEVKDLLAQDTILYELYDQCVNGKLSDSNYSTKQGLLF